MRRADPPLGSPDVYVTSPDGKVEKVPLARQHGPEFCAWLRFPVAGRYTVEVIGRGEGTRGRRALLRRRRRAAPHRRRRAAGAGADHGGGGQGSAARQINALRAAHGAPELTFDPRLTDLAQAYSDQMSREGFFAHVAPDGADLRMRLERAGYLHRFAGENLGLASGPLSAHFGIGRAPATGEICWSPATPWPGLA